MLFHKTIATPTKIDLFFVAPNPQTALHSALIFDDSEDAWDYIKEEGLDDQKLYRFSAYVDPESMEVFE